MPGYYEARKQYTLRKFLTDEHHRHKGYDKNALKLAAAYSIQTFGVSEIYAAAAPCNKIAKRLYSPVGFEATGVTENNTEQTKFTC